MSPAISAKYAQVQSVLKAAGFTFVGTCASASRNPVVVAPNPYSNDIYIDELQYHITNNLQVNISVFEVLLNGVYAWSSSTNTVGPRFSDPSGCKNNGFNVSQTVRDSALGPAPAGMSNVYNEYYDKYGVDLVMGPTSICDFVKWTVRVA